MSSCLLIGIAICEYLPVSIGPSSEGATLLLEISFLLWLLIAAITLAAVVYCAAICVVDQRPYVLAWALPFLAALAAAMFVPKLVRTIAFARLAGRCEGLIASIESFEQRHGRPPSELSELPDFDRSWLATGMRGYPDIEYSRWGDAWQLDVHCSHGLINFDRFVYRSDGDYRELLYEGSVQTIGDWAYLWE